MDRAEAQSERSSLAQAVRRLLTEQPELIREDPELLRELGLKHDAANLVDFGPAALARVHEAHRREAGARKQLEATAQANFAAQAQTHGAVIDLLESRNQSDLARRVNELSQLRFGLAAGMVSMEGPARVPAGWVPLAQGQIDLLLGTERLTMMGFDPIALPLFGEQAGDVKSFALVRLAMWEPARTGLIGFGSRDPHGFTPEMGTELVTFLARVVERTAERWPIL
jgi:uncharacterized protein